jgi:uracil-DNA glycosylase
LGLPEVTLPLVPKIFADHSRRSEILDEIEEAKPDVLLLLGDEPIKHFLAAFARGWRKLADFGKGTDVYGRLHDTSLDGRQVNVLPLAHPHQVSGLGSHSPTWRELHRIWKTEVAPRLLR